MPEQGHREAGGQGDAGADGSHPSPSLPKPTLLPIGMLHGEQGAAPGFGGGRRRLDPGVLEEARSQLVVSTSSHRSTSANSVSAPASSGSFEMRVCSSRRPRTSRL